MRARSAPYILDFLHRQFKESQRLSIPDSDLRAALQDYQEAVREADPDALPNSASAYLSAWCRDETRYLHRFYAGGEAGGEASFQLTPHSEEVLQFLDRVMANELGFVATESRVRLVLESLKDIVVHSSDDPEERIRHLRGEQRRIEDEIARIEREGAVEKYHEVQVRERFGLVIELLKQLLGDFRHVEESFKEIARELQKRQAGAEARPGELLGFALDAEDVLRGEDQGVSFEAFTNLILSHRKQEELHDLIEQVASLSELATQQTGVRTLRSTPRQLLAEARKVMATTQRLSSSLRLLLDDRGTADRRRTREMLRQIRDLAAGMAEEPPADGEIELALDLGAPPMRSPMTRDFWAPPAVVAKVEAREGEEDAEAREAAFRQYAAMARLDWPEMRRRIGDLTAGGRRVPLSELLEAHPPKSGVIEVVGYVQLARDGGHLVDAGSPEKINVPAGGGSGSPKRIELPKVVFLPRRRATG